MHGFGAYRAALLDVSLKGVLVARPADCLPAPGSRATLEIRLDGSERVIRTDATVARSSDGLLAFSCHGLDLESAAELRRLVELNLGDETLLERELEALAD